MNWARSNRPNNVELSSIHNFGELACLVLACSSQFFGCKGESADSGSSASVSTSPSSDPFTVKVRLVDKEGIPFSGGNQVSLTIGTSSAETFVTDSGSEITVPSVSSGEKIVLNGVSAQITGNNAFTWNPAKPPSVEILAGTLSYNLTLARLTYTEFDTNNAIQTDCTPSAGDCGWPATIHTVAEAISPAQDLYFCSLGIGLQNVFPKVMGLFQGNGPGNSPGDGFYSFGGDEYPTGVTTEGQKGEVVDFCAIDNIPPILLHSGRVYWVFFYFDAVSTTMHLNGYTSDPLSGMGLVQSPNIAPPWSSLSGLAGGMKKFDIWLAQ